MKVQINKGKHTDSYLIVAEDNEQHARSICLSHDECVLLYGRLWESVILDDALKEYNGRRRDGK